MIDLLICIGLVLGTAVAIFSICDGIYWLCERHEYLRPCTKEAKKWKEKVDKENR